MNEIKIYSSLWKRLLLFFSCLVFVAIIIIELFVIRDIDVYKKAVLIFGLFFFGLGGLYLLALTVKEKIYHIPFLLINDDELIINKLKKQKILFKQVKSFSVINVSGAKQIGVHYKSSVEYRKYKKSNRIKRQILNMNNLFAHCIESIPASDLTIKPQELCDLLNERLKIYLDSRNV